MAWDTFSDEIHQENPGFPVFFREKNVPSVSYAGDRVATAMSVPMSGRLTHSMPDYRVFGNCTIRKHNMLPELRSALDSTGRRRSCWVCGQGGYRHP